MWQTARRSALIDNRYLPLDGDDKIRILIDNRPLGGVRALASQVRHEGEADGAYLPKHRAWLLCPR